MTDTVQGAPQPRRRFRIPAFIVAALALFVLGALVGLLLLPRLLPVDGHAHNDAEDLYTCPMHPQVLQEGPGTCPICFMDLVPKNAAGGQQDAADARLHVTPRDRVLAGVKTVNVEYATTADTVTAAAVVQYDEAAQRVVTARYGGRIERLLVDRTGQTVRRGQPLMELYSPELVSAQKEYLIALESRELGTGRRETLQAAARRKLVLLGMTDAQITALEQRGDIAYTVTMYAPASGVVMARPATEGAYVTEGTLLLEIVDLSRVWVIANVFESDIARVRTGLPMHVSGPALAGTILRGTVEYIYPTVDVQSRTVKVRGVFANAAGALKPGMYLTATMPVQEERSLVVPVNAVLQTGRRSVVYVEVRRGEFEQREVQTGGRSNGYYRITAGLKAGDRVVAEGGYLLDSERQLTAPEASAHTGHSQEARHD